jgi:hypothetical protein
MQTKTPNNSSEVTIERHSVFVDEATLEFATEVLVVLGNLIRKAQRIVFFTGNHCCLPKENERHFDVHAICNLLGAGISVESGSNYKSDNKQTHLSIDCFAQSQHIHFSRSPPSLLSIISS